MDKETLLSCRDVSLGYEGHTVWEHLTFSVHSGEYLCIVGENGSGKSTLLKSLLGLLPPLKGVIRRSDTAGAVGYLPQQTQAQRDFPATVSEVVLSGFLSARGRRFFYSAAEKSQALMHMGKLGILELKDRCYRELSGGQQQRVLLARALCAARRLLILDAPVTGLDPAAAQDLYRTLAYLNKNEGLAIVMVTHDLQSALQYADTVLYAGQGTARDGLRAQKSQKARDAYRQANESDFIIADAAARYFKAHGITKLPARKALQAEIEQLISEKDGLYNTYHEQKQRFKELQTVKRNIDQILRREEPHRRKEQSHER